MSPKCFISIYIYVNISTHSNTHFFTCIIIPTYIQTYLHIYIHGRRTKISQGGGELIEPARARRARKFFHALGTIFAPLWAYFLNFSGERGTSPPPERLSQGNFPLPSPSSTPILTNHIVLHAYFRLKTSALLELLRLHHRYFFMGKKYMHVQGTKIGVLCTHIGDLGTKPEQKSWSGFGFEGGIIIIRYLFLLCNPKHDPLNGGYTVWFWV